MGVSQDRPGKGIGLASDRAARRASKAAHAEPSRTDPGRITTCPPARTSPVKPAEPERVTFPEARTRPLHDDPDSIVRSPSTTSTPAPLPAECTVVPLCTSPDQQPRQPAGGGDRPGPTRWSASRWSTGRLNHPNRCPAKSGPSCPGPHSGGFGSVALTGTGPVPKASRSADTPSHRAIPRRPARIESVVTCAPGSVRSAVLSTTALWPATRTSGSIHQISRPLRTGVLPSSTASPMNTWISPDSRRSRTR